MNCEKNAIDCEGYREKTIWKSGKERAEEGKTVTWKCKQNSDELIPSAARRSLSLPNIKLPAVINGVETAGDMMFFEHYIFRLSSIFTVEGEQNNAFKCMLLPMAVQHPGLMHSILALSSKHIDYRSAYGIRFLKDHPEVDIETLERRSLFHQHEALNELNADIERQKKGDKPNVTLPATFGQMLCLVLETLSDPNPKGLHRVHLEAYQSLVKECPPEDGEFQKFIHEFFQYHICADELIALPADRVRLCATSDDWNLPTTIVQPDAVRLLGVSDGLFLYMSKITNIRNEVRENLQNGIDPPVGYNALYAAALIDAGIREWKPVWPAGDSRDLAGLLYKQMMWVYLWRTIHPPRCSSWEPNAKITEAVNDGIKILSSLDPRDPSQTLILAPAFVLGCAAFEPAQREPIRKAIGVVKAYMEYRNSDTALEVLEEVWRLMDAKDERSWDWQSIAHGMGMDFLATCASLPASPFLLFLARCRCCRHRRCSFLFDTRHLTDFATVGMAPSSSFGVYMTTSREKLLLLSIPYFVGLPDALRYEASISVTDYRCQGA
jgi:hypothetical protein